MPVDDLAIRAIGLGVLLPAFVSAAVVIAFAFLGPRWQGAGALGGPLALAAAMWAGYFTLELGPFTPAGTGWEWLPHLAVLALPAGGVVARSRPRVFTLPFGV